MLNMFGLWWSMFYRIYYCLLWHLSLICQTMRVALVRFDFIALFARLAFLALFAGLTAASLASRNGAQLQ